VARGDGSDALMLGVLGTLLGLVNGLTDTHDRHAHLTAEGAASTLR
jgi:hypothetical protein